MQLEEKHNEISIAGSGNKPITADIRTPKSKTKTPLVIFCHGFKGFKDWGHFNWISTQFAKQKLAFLKFNFSHNGIKPPILNEITDLEAFANNNYSIELQDLLSVIDYVCENAETYNIDKNQIYLLAHSRGGGIALLTAANDKRIKKLALWASLSNFEDFFREETIKEWEEKGKVMVPNSRTNVAMPLYKQFYDDYLKNKKNLDVVNATHRLEIPLLIIHGTNDETVPIKHAESIYNIVQHSILIKVDGAGHTFGATHNFKEETDITETLEELIENTIEFFID